MQRKTFRIRPGVKITNTSQIEMTSGRTTSGEEESGENRIFEFLDDSGHYVKIAYTVWDNEERDIRPIEAEGSRPLERLNAGRLRLALYSIRNGSYRSVDNLFCVLRQARVKEESENQWSNLFNATPIELDEGAGLESSANRLNQGSFCSKLGRESRVSTAEGGRRWLAPTRKICGIA